MSAGQPEEAGHPRRWRMLPLVLSAMFLAQFDFFAVNIAAPALRQDLQVSDAELELIVGGYAFTFASGMVTGGRLGDLFGYRRLFLIGTVLFVGASVLCGVSPDPATLVAARLLHGLAGAALVPQVLALITATFPVRERPRALSWFGIVGSAAGVAGQLLGGLLLDANLFGLGWRNLFLVNLPVGIVVLVLAARVLPHAAAVRRPRLDPVGAVGLSLALALALVPLGLGHHQGWPPWTWVSLALAAPTMVLTVRWERRLMLRGGQPLLDLALFRQRAFSGGLAVNAAFLAFWGSFMFVLALLLQSGLGLTASQAGLAVMPLAVAYASAAMLGRRFAARHGARVLPAGAAITAGGLVCLIGEVNWVGTSLSPLWLVVPLLLVGWGNGLILPLLIGTVLTGVPTERAGAASGVLTTTQQFASAAGVAVVGAVFLTRLGDAGMASAAVVALSVDLLLVLTAGVLMVLLLGATPLRRRVPVTPPPAPVLVGVGTWPGAPSPEPNPIALAQRVRVTGSAGPRV